MKIENEVYVLAHHEFNDEINYLTEDYFFDDDIRSALKFKSNISAGLVRRRLVNDSKIDLDIIPLKITYEW